MAQIVQNQVDISAQLQSLGYWLPSSLALFSFTTALTLLSWLITVMLSKEHLENTELK